jgi:hypothetical protein
MPGAGASVPQIRTEYELGAQALDRSGPGGRTLHNVPQSQPGKWIRQGLRNWVALANFVPVLDIETPLSQRQRTSAAEKMTCRKNEICNSGNGGILSFPLILSKRLPHLKENGEHKLGGHLGK